MSKFVSYEVLTHSYSFWLILETQQQVIMKQMMNHASTHEETPIEDINRFFNIHQNNDPQSNRTEVPKLKRTFSSMY
jgi:hypothetical protein